MTNWKEFRLGEIINLKRGHDLPSSERTEGSYPIISSSGISGWHNEPKCKGPGVVTGRYGTIGQLFYIDGDYWPLNTTLYVDDFKGQSPKFIYYFLKTFDFHKFNDKSTIPGINRNHLHEEVVAIPNLPTQTRIAAILSALDDKIELNRQMNHTLEQMAQALFKKYFVDDIDPENLPEGWRMGKLKDVISKANTGADAIKRAPIVEYETEWRCARVGDLANKRPYQEWGFCEVTNDVFENFRLRKNDILITRTATLGLNTIINEDISAVFNNGLIRIRIDSGFDPLYVYQAMQSDGYSIYIDRASGDSSTRPNMQINYLLDYPLLLPPIKVQTEFSSILRSLILKKSQNDKEIYGLIDLRDAILPKLMSGEIEIKEAETLVA